MTQVTSAGMRTGVVAMNDDGTLASFGGGSSAPFVLTPLGDRQFTVTSSALELSTVSGSIPTGSTIVAIDVTGGVVRFTTDGTTAPTTTIGRRLLQDATMEYSGDLTKFQVILESGSPILNLSFFK